MPRYEHSITLGNILQIVTIFGGLLAAWINMNERLVTLESQMAVVIEIHRKEGWPLPRPNEGEKPVPDLEKHQSTGR